VTTTAPHRSHGPASQGGAVMMIAILFLLVIVAVMAQTLVTMSGSDVLDSADHANATETLFIAEAAIERASWQLVNGSSCSTLAPQGPFALGRGSYSITSSLLGSNLCSITVTAALGSSNRTIEADLSVGGSGGWAVGDDDSGRATLLNWDGTSWTSTGPWPGVPNEKLHSVHCTDSTNCWAVGKKSGGAVMLRWQGSSWVRHANSASIPAVDLNGVYCVDANDCWSVGKKNGGAVTLHWDGNDWSRITTVVLPDKDLAAIHCAASDDCWAIGKRNGGSGLFAHWDGNSWSQGSSTFTVLNKDLSDVFCTASNDCHAVGKKGTFSENITRRTSGNWFTNITFFALPRVDLRGINCSASNDCWVVGQKSGSEMIGHWNGTSWSRFTSATVSNENLNAVAVVSSTEAYTVGDKGTIAHWDGAIWSDQTSPTTKKLRSVSVVSGNGSGGTGNLINWHETIF